MTLLDLQLPDRSGFDLLPELRLRSAMPVIVVTARLLGHDKVRALDLGADDYITKPFWAEELLARLRAVVRRARQDATAVDVQEFGTLRIDVPGRQVSVAGAFCSLTPTEFNLLRHLARRPRAGAASRAARRRRPAEGGIGDRGLAGAHLAAAPQARTRRAGASRPCGASATGSIPTPAESS